MYVRSLEHTIKVLGCLCPYAMTSSELAISSTNTPASSQSWASDVLLQCMYMYVAHLVYVVSCTSGMLFIVGVRCLGSFL